MTSYPTKYLFIAETQGIKQATDELNKMYAAAQKAATSGARLNIGASREVSAEARATRDLANAEAARQRSLGALANAENARQRTVIQGIKAQQQQVALQQKQIALNSQQEIAIRKVAGAQADLNAKEARAALAQAKLDKFGDSGSDGGWQGLAGYVEKFGNRMRSALAYSLAFGAVGATFAAVGGSIRAWVDAQIQLNDVIADSAILLGRTADEGMRFASIQRELSFATGQSLAELAPASMMAERVGQPELAVSAAEWSMVVGPQLTASETVDDLRALSIQFGLSMDEINNSLLATLQNSGIAADQLFDLSASFGVFAGQLGLGESARDMREIAGLFAALSNITGQTTPTLQNFVRRMADEFYDPNAALRQQLNAAGIQTVTQGPVTTTYDMFGNATKTSEEIRRPFTEIFAEIATKGPAAIKAFSTAIDNSLGQPTQSQFILVAENWDSVSSIIGNVVTSTVDFADAAQTASEKLSIAVERVKSGFVNMLSVLGDSGMLKASLDQIGSAFQNTYDALRDPDEGMRHLSRTGRRGLLGNELDWTQAALRPLESELDRAYGSSGDNLLTRRLHEILRVAQMPEGLPSNTGYLESAIRQFIGSDYVRQGDLSTTGAQAFLEFQRSGDFSRIDAMRASFAGIGNGPDDVDRVILERFGDILTEIEKRVLRGSWSSPSGAGLATFPWQAVSTAELPSPYMTRSSGLRNMMLGPDLAKKMGPVWDFPSVSLPEDVTPQGFDKAYDEVSSILTDRFGPAIGDAEVEIIAFRDSASGLTVSLGAYNEYVTQEAIKYLQASGKTEDASITTQTAFYDLAGAAGAASAALGSILSRARITLPEGMTADEWQSEYYKTERALLDTYGSGANISSETNKPYVFMDPATGMPLTDGADLNPDFVQITNLRLAAEKAASEKALAEQKGYQSKSLAAQEAYQNKMLGAWNGMVSDLLKPSSVTGTDLFYNSPRGTYNDNWDEPVRRMKADINNALGGRALEYGYGGLGQYMNMDAINAAMGMDQAAKESILRSEEARVAEQFYNMELPWEAYAGNTDSIIANAQAWIAGKQQKNANMANVQQLLIDAGLGPDAEAFVKAMEEPPILRSLFGGKSADEINTTVTEAVTPDMGKALTEQVANTPWSLTISGAIQKDVTNNYEVIVSAGMAIGKGLAEGSASMFAAAIIPLVLAAIVGRE